MLPDEKLEQMELRKLLRVLFEEMPRAQKAAFIGVYLDGKTPRELAEEWEVTPNAVHRSLRMGMSHLAKFGGKRQLLPYFEKRP
ncbi:MAG: hypothetical protein NT108_02160 [Candidatus Kaiserbacteria bacterium]|nr:hypothetical protein [Candidatus Kaiserbacteria bacterium]